MRTLVVVAALAIPAIASAHVTLLDPPPRTTEQKARHCGDPAAARSATPKVLAPGSTYTVKWRETIDHTGHYRISFDNDGIDFFIPPNATATTVGMDPTVMIDLIPDVQGNLPAGGRMYSQTITLPNVECTNCTLQLIQLMADKPPYTTAATSDDIYFQCADITLSNGAPPPPPPMVDAGMTTGDSGTTDPGSTNGGCSAGGGRSGFAAMLVALGLVVARRRRE